MPSNPTNDRDKKSRQDNAGADSRSEYSRANNDSLGSSSRSGRGGSWSNRDDEDQPSPPAREAKQSAQSENQDGLNERVADGGSRTSAYGNEQSASGVRFRSIGSGQSQYRGDVRPAGNRNRGETSGDSSGNGGQAGTAQQSGEQHRYNTRTGYESERPKAEGGAESRRDDTRITEDANDALMHDHDIDPQKSKSR